MATKSVKGHNTIPPWYQDVIEAFQIDMKLDILSEYEILTMKTDCNTLKHTIGLARESKKELEFVLKVLPPSTAVYPTITTAFNLTVNVIGKLEQLKLQTERRIVYNDQKMDWNVCVDLQREEILSVERMKKEDSYLCSIKAMFETPKMKHKANVKGLKFTKKEFFLCFIIMIFIIFDPFCLFSDM